VASSNELMSVWKMIAGTRVITDSRSSSLYVSNERLLDGSVNENVINTVAVDYVFSFRTPLSDPTLRPFIRRG
jgi:hypothetical protein